MTLSLSSMFQSARKQTRSNRRRAAAQTPRQITGGPLGVEVKYQTSEVLENRTLLAAQLVSSDLTERTISPGETFEVEVRYQTLDDAGNPAALKASLIGFNLLFDADQIEWIETPNSGVFTEGAQVLPNEVRLESEDAIKDDNDPDTESALVAAYSDNDPLFNAGWPNNIDTNGIALYTARFRANDNFTGTTIHFTDNATGNVVGQNAAFEFQSQSLQLTPPAGEPVVSVSNASAVEGDSVSFTVTLDSASDETVSVVYSTIDTNGPDGATAGTDYTAQTGQTLTFTPGQTSQTIQIATIDDAFPEVSEIFLLQLTSPTGATLGTAEATGTITDNDDADLPTVSISDAAAVEEGGSASFTLTLSAASDSPISVSYATQDTGGPDSATAGLDYTAQTNGTVTFSPGQTSQTIQITTIDDSVDEESEVFFVNLTSAPGATILASQATGTITDNDAAELPTVSISDAATVEEGGSALFTVALSAASDSPISVSYATQDTGGPDSATAGLDYTAQTNGTVTFSPGQTSQTIQITTIDDSVDEESEVFFVNLTSAPGATILASQATGTITDNDAAELPTVSISDAAIVVEGQVAVFPVTLSAASDSVVTVNYATDSSGPTAATPGLDFTGVANGTLTFPAGTTSQTISIATIDDGEVEQTETFSVVLSGAVGATVASASGDVSLTDNDVSGESGTARIRKFHDQNGDGQKSDDEPWLNGWTIQLLSTSGQVVAEGVTADIDLNGDQQIDPATERGWVMLDVAAGTYAVQETSQTGWIQTTPTTAAAATAYELDQEYNFETTRSDFLNWGGLGERWIFSNEGWFFVTPAGELYQWDSSPASNLTGTKVATLTADYHGDLTLLVDVPPADAPEMTIVAGQESDVLVFGNLDATATGSISGRKWNDLNGDGQRSDDEPWLNGWTVELLDSLGSVVASTVTSAVDLNNDGTIDPITEAGVYSFDDLAAGHYSVREVMVDGWIQTSPFSAEDEAAFELDSQYQLESTSGNFENWGGLGERWIRGGDSWFYLTPNGSLYQWNNSPKTNLSGNLVGQLDTRYYDDLTLLTSAVDPAAVSLELSVGEDLSDVNFGNQEGDTGGGNSGFNGAGNIRVRVSGTSLTLNGDGSANGVSVYLNENGYVTIAGMGQTTIDGQSEMVLEGWTSIETDLKASLAGGDDAFVLSGVAVGRNLTVNSSSGDDSVLIQNSTVAGRTSVSDSSGDNTFVATDSVMSGDVSVSLGSGRDLVHLLGVSAGGMTVTARGNADGVVAQDSSFSGVVRVSLGAGDDELVTLGNTEFGDRVVINGQAGTNLLSASAGTTFASDPVVRRIDSDAADPAGLLDEIMQRLADAGLDELI